MLLDLELRQFRCHQQLRLSFQPGWNLILGANGEGKSSVLEAIYYLGRLKSYRTAVIREMVRWQQPGFHLGLRHVAGPQEEEMSIRWEKGTRTYLVNRQPVEKLEECWGRVPLVLLAADDQLLIRGPALRRQQWLDSLVAYREASHLGLVQRYNATLRQRNAWLRQGAVDRRLGEALTVQLTEAGQKITGGRTRMLQQVQTLLHTLSAKLMAGEREMVLDYRPSFSSESAPDWSQVWGNEQRLGRTLLGPHRDELTVTLRGQSLARYGSEGEQRLGVLLLRLSEVHAIRQARGQWPVLLLDDVLNPLDAARKQAWIQEIPPEVQVVLATTAWPSDLAVPKKSTVVKLRQGAGTN